VSAAENPAVIISESAVSEAVTAALAAIAAAPDAAGLKAIRNAHVGEASPLAALNAALKDVPNDQKAAAGKLVGQARAQANQAYAAREAELVAAEQTAQLAAEAVDVTAAASRTRVGARHPLMLLQESVCDAFVGMGWEIAKAIDLIRKD
jgi:phenylalanyl-tRNA synthetase alpha chain